MTRTSGALKRVVLREDHLGASTYVEKGWNLIAIGDFSSAEVALLQALDLAPTDIYARALLAWALMRQGVYDAAEKLLTQLLTEDPLHAMARVNLGYVQMRKREFLAALELLESCSQQIRDPKAALYARFYLGLLFFAQKDFAGAEHCFKKSVALAPNFIEGYYELGRAQLAGGRDEEARTTWKAGHAANRFNVWGKRCVEAIRLADRGERAPTYS
jgi:tetratricopeptide (TPR) repeat protein